MRSSWQLRDQADRILNRRQAQSPPPGSRLSGIIASGHKGDNAPAPGGTHGDSGRISMAAPRYRREARSSGRRAEVPRGLSRQRARAPRYVTPLGGFFVARVWMLRPAPARPLCSRLCASMHHTRPGSIRAGTARIPIRLERPTARPDAINISPTELGVRATQRRSSQADRAHPFQSGPSLPSKSRRHRSRKVSPE